MNAVAIQRSTNGSGVADKTDPPSSDHEMSSKQVDANEIVSSIASKIHGGGASSPSSPSGNDSSGEVTAADLAKLRTVAFDSEDGIKTIPILDRSYLRTGGTTTSASSSSIVRLVGFVQDQLDPEYYQTQVNGRSTKYRDYVYNGNDDNDTTGNQSYYGDGFDPMGPMGLAERQPLVVVPLPFTSQWFRDGLLANKGRAINNDQKSEDMEQEEQEDKASSSSNNKRSREDDENNTSTAEMQVESTEGGGGGGGGGGGEVSSPARKIHQTDASIAATSNEINRDEAMPTNNDKNADAASPNCVTSPPNHLDWWPAGTMGSDEDQVPVLAKVYYDDEEDDDCGGASNQDVEVNRLRLNDVVDLVGVVHFDPMEADFSGQQQQQQGGGSSGIIAQVEDALGSSFDDLSLLDRGSLPPPSLLPRLHVLCYNRLDLDVAARKVVLGDGNNDDAVMKDESAQNASANESTDDRTFAVNALSDHLFSGKKAAGEALLMALMSMAEREASSNSAPGRPMQTPSSLTLGCASLNIVLPTAQACENLQERLNATLRQVAPVVASAELSLDALAAGNSGGGNATASQSVPVGSPAKTNEGRLAPSLMQLPKGATLLINQGPLAEGRIDEHGHRTLVALSGLTQNHTVPYRFDGMMDYQFEGDYRVIILSEGTGKSSQGNSTKGEKLLGCTLKMKLSAPEYQGGASQTLPSETADRIRLYIARCRGYADSANIDLSREILSQAERDFVDRRVANRERQRRSPSAEIGENDFHRWLTITRLQARSKLGVEMATKTGAGAGASLGDWADALKLDDDMKIL